MTTTNEHEIRRARREHVATMSREQLLELTEALEQRIDDLVEDASASGPRAMAGMRWGNISDQTDAMSHLLYADPETGWNPDDEPSMAQLMELPGAEGLDVDTMLNVANKLHQLAQHLIRNEPKPKN